MKVTLKSYLENGEKVSSPLMPLEAAKAWVRKNKKAVYSAFDEQGNDISYNFLNR